MRIPRKLFAAALVCFFIVSVFGCKEQYKGPPADFVIKKAKIVTIDVNNPRAEALAVRGEKIIDVTSNKNIKQYIKEGTTKVIDAKGRLVVPGFNDAHIHFSGIYVEKLDLHDVTDFQVIQQMVKERVAKLKPGEWITGGGWEQERFPEKKWPTKEILDEVAPDNPVRLSRIDGHSVWVNSYVIKLSDITKDTPDPPGGTIVKDPVTGEPTGVFKETAGRLLKRERTQTLKPEEEQERSDRAIERAIQEAASYGVTSIQHLEGRQDQFKRFLDKGKLTLRVTFNRSLKRSEEHLTKMDALRKQYPPENNWLRFGYLKGFIDGTLGSATALYSNPYESDPGTSGLPQMSYEELEHRVIAADKMGFQIGIHATGDKANHWILNAYEKAQKVNGKRDSRHRSEHATSIVPDDFTRFAELGVVASVQPSHLIVVKRIAQKRIGLERCRSTYAFKSFLDAGVHVALGTDWNLVSMNPLVDLYAAVTRKDPADEQDESWFPEQKILMEKAIELYTLESAYAEFMEDRKGMLKVGYLADMVILSNDLLTIPHDEIMKTKVDYTIVGGKVVFQRDGVE
ncbi:amidohydrolase [Acidobacteriota bacterium]